MKGQLITLLYLLASVLEAFCDPVYEPPISETHEWLEYRNWRIRSTWDNIYCDPQTFAKGVINRMFKTHPEHQPKNSNLILSAFYQTSTVYRIMKHIIHITLENTAERDDLDYSEIGKQFKDMGYTIDYIRDLQSAITDELSTRSEGLLSATDEQTWIRLLQKLWRPMVEEFQGGK